MENKNQLAHLMDLSIKKTKREPLKGMWGFAHSAGRSLFLKHVKVEVPSPQIGFVLL